MSLCHPSQLNARVQTTRPPRISTATFLPSTRHIYVPRSVQYRTSLCLASSSGVYRLVCDFCSSGREFASSFFQIPSHGGHPCSSLTVPTAKSVVDFHHQVVVHAAHTRKGLRPVAGGGPWKREAGGALLSRALERSIIAAGDLNGRVRDGNGCVLPARATSQRTWQPDTLESAKRRRTPRGAGCFPLPGTGFPRRGKGRRPGLTAYQKRYAEALAGLAHPPCRPGGLPGAFRALRRGTARLRGGLALRCLQRLSLRGLATRRCP